MKMTSFTAAISLFLIFLNSCDSKSPKSSHSQDQLDTLTKEVNALRLENESEKAKKDSEIHALKMQLEKTKLDEQVNAMKMQLAELESIKQRNEEAKKIQTAKADLQDAGAESRNVQAVCARLLQLTTNSKKAETRADRNNNLKKIAGFDVSGCPLDFRVAWFRFVDSANKVVEANNAAPESEIEALLYLGTKISEGKTDGGQNELLSTIQKAETEMYRQANEMMVIARKYGVK